MTKRTPPRLRWHNDTRTRAAMPIAKDGMVLCPFCKPTHPLTPGTASCGTVVQVTAVQTVFRNKPCALCGKSDHEQVFINGVYVHSHPCSPGKFIYTIPPKPSKWAKVAYHLPRWSNLIIGRLFGIVSVEVSDKDNASKPLYSWEKLPKRRDHGT